MKRRNFILSGVSGALASGVGCVPTGFRETHPSRQYLLFNLNIPQRWDPNRADGNCEAAFKYVHEQWPSVPEAPLRVGMALKVSLLNLSDNARTLLALGQAFKHSEAYDVPVFVSIDEMNWWGQCPNLWNWWDPSKPGFDESNRMNVEWTDWTPDSAVRLCWRDWGRQIRVLPQPNLMSPQYRHVVHEQLAVFVPSIMAWQRQLAPERRYLFAGIELGWETSIGVSYYHFPNGNQYWNQPDTEDPQYRLTIEELPGRGMAAMGYAAVKTAGIKTGGDLTGADQAEVVRRHFEDFCLAISEMGVPREFLFTHTGGWADGEDLYQSGLNPYSCPGLSFYTYAQNIRDDRTAWATFQESDAPCYSAAEWLLQGERERERWFKALRNAFDDPRCRLLVVYNWIPEANHPEVMATVRKLLNQP